MANLIKHFFELIFDNILSSIYNEKIEPILYKKVFIVISNDNLEFDNEKIFFQLYFELLYIIIFFLIVVMIIFAIKLNKSRKKSNDNEEILLSKALKSLKDDNKYILSAQIYKFTINREFKGKLKKRRIIIDHMDSHYNQGIDINAVVHQEFEIEEKYFSVVEKFAEIYDKYEKTGNIHEKNMAISKVQLSLTKMKNEIAVPKDKIGKKQCVIFSLYKGIQCVIGTETWESDIAGIDKDTCDLLRNGVRTGCLPAILLSTAYIFRNGDSITKKDRIYYTVVPDKNILPKGYKNILVILTLSYSQIKDKEESFLKDSLYEEINNYIKNSLSN